MALKLHASSPPSAAHALLTYTIHGQGSILKLDLLEIELCLWIVHITILCCHASACSLIGFQSTSTSPGRISVPSLHVIPTLQNGMQDKSLGTHQDIDIDCETNFIPLCESLMWFLAVPFCRSLIPTPCRRNGVATSASTNCRASCWQLIHSSGNHAAQSAGKG